MQTTYRRDPTLRREEDEDEDEDSVHGDTESQKKNNNKKQKKDKKDDDDEKKDSDEKPKLCRSSNATTIVAVQQFRYSILNSYQITIPTTPDFFEDEKKAFDFPLQVSDYCTYHCHEHMYLLIPIECIDIAAKTLSQMRFPKNEDLCESHSKLFQIMLHIFEELGKMDTKRKPQLTCEVVPTERCALEKLIAEDGKYYCQITDANKLDITGIRFHLSCVKLSSDVVGQGSIMGKILMDLHEANRQTSYVEARRSIQHESQSKHLGNSRCPQVLWYKTCDMNKWMDIAEKVLFLKHPSKIVMKVGDSAQRTEYANALKETIALPLNHPQNPYNPTVLYSLESTIAHQRRYDANVIVKFDDPRCIWKRYVLLAKNTTAETLKQQGYRNVSNWLCCCTPYQGRFSWKLNADQGAIINCYNFPHVILPHKAAEIIHTPIAILACQEYVSRAMNRDWEEVGIELDTREGSGSIPGLHSGLKALMILQTAPDSAEEAAMKFYNQINVGSTPLERFGLPQMKNYVKEKLDLPGMLPPPPYQPTQEEILGLQKILRQQQVDIARTFERSLLSEDSRVSASFIAIIEFLTKYLSEHINFCRPVEIPRYLNLDSNSNREAEVLRAWEDVGGMNTSHIPIECHFTACLHTYSGDTMQNHHVTSGPAGSGKTFELLELSKCLIPGTLESNNHMTALALFTVPSDPEIAARVGPEYHNEKIRIFPECPPGKLGLSMNGYLASSSGGSSSSSSSSSSSKPMFNETELCYTKSITADGYVVRNAADASGSNKQQINESRCIGPWFCAVNATLERWREDLAARFIQHRERNRVRVDGDSTVHKATMTRTSIQEEQLEDIQLGHQLTQALAAVVWYKLRTGELRMNKDLFYVVGLNILEEAKKMKLHDAEYPRPWFRVMHCAEDLCIAEAIHLVFNDPFSPIRNTPFDSSHWVLIQKYLYIKTSHIVKAFGYCSTQYEDPFIISIQNAVVQYIQQNGRSEPACIPSVIEGEQKGDTWSSLDPRSRMHENYDRYVAYPDIWGYDRKEYEILGALAEKVLSTMEEKPLKKQVETVIKRMQNEKIRSNPEDANSEVPFLFINFQRRYCSVPQAAGNWINKEHSSGSRLEAAIKKVLQHRFAKKCDLLYPAEYRVPYLMRVISIEAGRDLDHDIIQIPNKDFIDTEMQQATEILTKYAKSNTRKKLTHKLNVSKVFNGPYEIMNMDFNDWARERHETAIHLSDLEKSMIPSNCMYQQMEDNNRLYYWFHGEKRAGEALVYPIGLECAYPEKHLETKKHEKENCRYTAREHLDQLKIDQWKQYQIDVDAPPDPVPRIINQQQQQQQAVLTRKRLLSSSSQDSEEKEEDRLTQEVQRQPVFNVHDIVYNHQYGPNKELLPIPADLQYMLDHDMIITSTMIPKSWMLANGKKFIPPEIKYCSDFNNNNNNRVEETRKSLLVQGLQAMQLTQAQELILNARYD